MTSGGVSPEAATVVATFTERLGRLHERTEQARAAMADAEGSAVSDDAVVRVTVDAAGTLTDLRFGPGAEPGSAGLTATIMRTVRIAHRRALAQARDDVAAIVGESSEAVAVLDRQVADLGRPGAVDAPATRPDYGVDSGVEEGERHGD
jgi:hypothetical protein